MSEGEGRLNNFWEPALFCRQTVKWKEHELLKQRPEFENCSHYLLILTLAFSIIFLSSTIKKELINKVPLSQGYFKKQKDTSYETLVCMKCCSWLSCFSLETAALCTAPAPPSVMDSDCHTPRITWLL